MAKVGRKELAYDNLFEILSNPYRINFLEKCWLQKAKTLKEFQEMFKLSHRTTLYHINTLEKAGLVKVSQDEHKAGKPKEVKITPKGEQWLKTARPHLFRGK